MKQKKLRAPSSTISAKSSPGFRLVKRILISFGLGLLCSGLWVAQTHAASTYTYYRSIVVTSTPSVASGTLANFPMLFSGTYSWLEPALLGGTLQSASGYDHAYSTSTACTSFLNYQTASYVSSTGAIVDWIQVPTLATGTTLYICYDNSTVTSTRSSVTGTWSNQSLAGYWPLDEGSGSSATDFSGGNSTGTWTGTQASASGTYYAAGKIGLAGYWNGGTDAVNFVASNSLFQFATSSFSISAWINASTSAAASGSPAIFGVNFGSNGARYALDYDEPSTAAASNSLGLFLKDASGNSKTDNLTSNLIIQNAWYHVAMVVNQPSSTMSLYLNGSFVTSTSTSAVTGLVNPNGAATIGTVVNGTQGNFGGMMDDIRLYGRALSSQELLTDYNNQVNPSAFYAVGSQNALPDVTAPLIAITSPIQSSTVSSVVTLIASSTDNVAIAGVQFQIDGMNLGSEITATSGPTLYSTTWNTSSVSPGSHLISAIAYDTSNNSSSASVSVSVTPLIISTYTYYRSIVVTSTPSVASGTLANFPMLFSGTYSWLEPALLGGTLQSASGYDHAYSTSTACTSFLNYQTASYVSSTGAIVDWIQVPTLATGTTLYICYDNSTVTSTRSSVTGTWSNQSLAGYWPLDEGSGSSATDFSGGNSTGTWTGTQASASGTYYAAGKIGLAGYWNGGTDAVNFVASNSLFQFATSSFSISAWINASTSAAASGSPAIFGVNFGSNGARYALDYDEPSTAAASNSLGLFLKDASGNSKTDNLTSNLIIQNAWYHVAMVVNQPSSTMSLYLNGSFVTSTSTSAVTGLVNPNGAATIGTVVNGTQGNFGGMMDDIRLYGRALSSQELLTDYNNQVNPSAFYAVGSQNALPDVTAPLIAITSPIQSSTVSSVVTLIASSTDNVAIAGVQFQIDGMNLGSEITATSGPTLYSTTWNTSSVSPGSHLISAIAYDTSNNSSSASVSVSVTPLIISNITVTQTTTTSTQVTWTTNEPATTQVVYGTTSSYGSSTSLMDASGAFSHSVTLTGLFADITYHYAVKSVDLSSNPANSSDGNFKTLQASQTYYLQDFDSNCGQPGYNCRAAFQSAFATIAQAGGGILQLPPGNFELDFPEVAQNVNSGPTLTSSSLIIVPPNTTIQGYVGQDGTYKSTIQWSATSIPVFIFNNSSNSGMRDLHIQFTSSTPTLFPYGDIDLLEALGYSPTFPHENQMGGGNYEMFTFAYLLNSENCSFDHLLFDSATGDNNHVFGIALNLKGSGVVVSNGGGLNALASGNSITNVQLADYDLAFLVSGQNNMLIQNISGDWRGSTTAIAPGHLVYITGQRIYYDDTDNPDFISNTNMIIQNITEGSDTYSNASSLGTLAIKFLNNSRISNITSQHPEGLVQTMESDQDVNFSNMAWSSNYLLCENVPSNCGVPIVHFVSSTTPPTDNIFFQNINLLSTGDSVTMDLMNNNVSADGVYITTPAIFLPGQVNAEGVLSTKYTDATTITNYAFTPYMASYNATGSYNTPFTGWDTSYNVSANVTINWPSSISLPTSGNIVTSLFQDPNVTANNDILNQTILTNTVPPSAPTNLTVISSTGSTISLSWNPSVDSLGIAGYLISRGGVVVGITTSTTYSDTNDLAASTTYSYAVTAYDKAGNNSSSSTTVNATTQSANMILPTVAITDPMNGAGESGAVTVSATAIDPAGITKVELYVDGALTGTADVSPYSFSFNANSLAGGIHTLSVEAYDSDGNTNTSLPVFISLPVSSSGNPPTIVGVSGGGMQEPSQSLSTPVTSSTPSAPSIAPNSGSTGPSASVLSLVEGVQSLSREMVLSANGDSTLMVGSRDQAVWALQVYLIMNNILHPAGPNGNKLLAPTGYFGILTRNALAAYQAQVDIVPAQGVFGPKTRAYLKNMGGYRN